MSIDFATLNIFSITPIIIVLLGALGILAIDLIIGRFYRGLYASLCAMIVILSLASVFYENSSFLGAVGFFGFIKIDGFAFVAQVIILATSILFIFLSLSKNSYREFECAEYYALFLFMIAGYQFMVSSTNLIVIFLGLEASSLALYALIALSKTDKGLEAAIKYFTLGAVGSGFFAFGLVFIYGSVGSLEIGDLVLQLAGISSDGGFLSYLSTTNGNKYLLLLGFVFLLGAVGFKLSFFPFHSWVPDIYEGSNPPLAFYMSIATKIATFIVALRVFMGFVEFESVSLFPQIALFIIVVLTTTIPNIIALTQSDVQRMLAYSSISQAGFGLACIYVGSSESIVALFLYWILFLFSNLGAFALLWLTHSKEKRLDSRFCSPYAKFSGLIKTAPLIAISFAIFMLSLGGIPPFGLFWGKIFVISSAINSGHIVLALILLLNSGIAIYYYMKLIIFMFLKEPLNVRADFYTQNASGALVAIIVLALIVCVGAVAFLGIILAHLWQYLGL